jgi:hypothetical protein
MAHIHRALSIQVPLSLLSLVLLLAGCSHRDGPGGRGGAMVGVISVQVPVFLNGPMNVLLTNAGGFSARAVVQGDAAFSRETTGQLLCRGSKILFAPDPGTDKAAALGAFIFIWDASESRGFVLSESLQAYAPVSTTLRATNLLLRAGTAGPEKFDGHTCEPQEALVRMSDGATAAFRALRAGDLNGFPVHIGSTSSSLALTLSKVRFELPSTDLFSPPDSFSKFNSPEAMADELASRQRNFRRTRRGDSELFLPSGLDPNRRY